MVGTRGSGRRRPTWSQIAANLIPSLDNLYNLGSSSKRWAALFAVLAFVGAITVGNVFISETGDGWLSVNASVEFNGSQLVKGNSTVLGWTNITADGIAFMVSNSTGGGIFRINTTKGQTEFWDDAEGANDYISIYHDGSNGYFDTGSGGFYFIGATNSAYFRNLYPTSANAYLLGSPIGEWKSLSLGEDASSGIYLGLDQDERIYHNSTTDDLNFVGDEFKFWDDAEGANDYVSIKHTGVEGVINTQSGNLFFSAGGSGQYILSSSNFVSITANSRDLGATNTEWRALYLGEDASSGIYFGLDQDERIYHNSTTDDLNFVGDEFKFWDDGQGEDDYISVYHDGADGNFRSGTGDILFRPSGVTRLAIGSSGAIFATSMFPDGVSTRDMGSVAKEWKSLYTSEDTGSGIFFGLDQNFQLFYNETSADELQLVNSSGGQVMAFSESGKVMIESLTGGSDGCTVKWNSTTKELYC